MTHCDVCRCPLQHRKSTFNDPYYYTECGLSNVLLIDVDVYFCPKCKIEIADIPRPKCLHSLLAREILMKPVAMTGEEFRFLRKEVLMKPKEFADLVGIDPKTVTNWENSKSLGRQNDLSVRFVVAEILTQRSNLAPGFFDLDLNIIEDTCWVTGDEEIAELAETNTYLGMTNSGWEIGPKEID